ncbi:hypothetical protein VTH82DRAFT_7887 [Thermothelomyces myriococcoides]
MRTDYKSPVLLRANDSNFTYPPEWKVVNNHNHTAIRVNVNNKSPVVHPTHLHGHNFYVLREGWGGWDSTIIRPSNPTQQERHAGEIIVSDRRLTVPLPHRLARVRRLLSHADRQARKVERMETARDVEKNCQAWPMWTKYNIVVQIDSGT